eukprot:2162224-Amphidinium_carterae.2
MSFSREWRFGVACVVSRLNLTDFSDPSKMGPGSRQQAARTNAGNLNMSTITPPTTPNKPQKASTCCHGAKAGFAAADPHLQVLALLEDVEVQVKKASDDAARFNRYQVRRACNRPRAPDLLPVLVVVCHPTGTKCPPASDSSFASSQRDVRDCLRW